MNATINAIGTYVPERKIDNAFFEQYLDTNDEWIKSRTGIQTRYFAAENEYVSDLSVKAVENMMSRFNKTVDDVDFIIVATSTPDQMMPNVASQVQTRLGIRNAGCIDLTAACAGFAYGIIMAKGLIAAETHKKVLVIGAETISKVLDLEDRTTCILFGDGAGAVLVEASEENHLFKPLATTDGAFGKDLYISHQPAPICSEAVLSNGNIHQNGRTVFKWAVSTLTEKLPELAKINKFDLSDIDWMIPHSANIRILEAVCEAIGYPVEKCLESVRNFGNTSAATIPLAWDQGIKNGSIKVDDKILIAGFGGGLTVAGLCLINKIDNK